VAPADGGEVIKEYVVFDTSQIATMAAVVPEESPSQKRQGC
jgi:hypothetical protein